MGQMGDSGGAHPRGYDIMSAFVVSQPLAGSKSQIDNRPLKLTFSASC